MNKKIRKLTFLLPLFLLFINISCGGSDDSSEHPNPQLPEVSTLQPQLGTGSQVTLRGSVDDLPSNTVILRRGVCWATTNNPTIGQDNFVEDSQNQVGEFSFEVSGLQDNTQYYVRAYCENSAGLQYGNSVSFTTGISQPLVTTLEPTTILTTSATLKGSFSTATLSTVGFVYATTQNPTMNNANTSELMNGPDIFDMDITGLTPNTVYYVRSFINTNGNLTYGEQKQLKTTGYFGPAGGYVFYDKGVTTDPWRYMEVFPETRSYDISQTTGSQWGNTGTFIQTSDAIGAGLENSIAIQTGVSQANCAAKLCLGFQFTEFDDWFLGSSQEMFTAAKAMRAAGVTLGGGSTIWTSTQVDATYAKSVWFNGTNFEISNSSPKTFPNLLVLPMRRY
ncbi:hypothetical protein [Flavobacterium sp.]|uniref:hypothetical protein n=1 Tax=Flavobacterium sp. TaxID=239 RepID=UPI00122911D5|nr:hypothetical protein [Flavobacterium sp.]RZJ71542.1 MAG: hypothetical protein EOO49_09285 [Flavobacterium sp.]